MGFIKLSDDLPNWAWYGDNNTLSVYIRLLIGAVLRETEYQNTTLQRGQIATTLPKIAKENGITERQARTILDRLKATGRVSVKTTSKFSIITLNNYDCAFENVSQSDRQDRLFCGIGKLHPSDQKRTQSGAERKRERTPRSLCLITARAAHFSARSATPARSSAPPVLP